jgi:hypothetical protein
LAAGADVDFVCPAGHPARHLQGLGRRFHYALGRPLSALGRAIVESAPDLIIPCDDLAIDHLTRLAAAIGRPESSSDPLAAILEASLGPPEVRRILASRAGLNRLAREEGVVAPATDVLSSVSQLPTWMDRNGEQAHLKVDGSFGGDGTRQVQDRQQARAAFARLAAGPTLIDAAKEVITEQACYKLKLSLRLRRPIVSIQKSVVGSPANCSFACYEGEVLSVVAVKVMRTTRPLGVGTHVTTLESPAMREAASRIARRLKLTGIFGLDFMIEQSTGRPWLIELNARPTPVSHFRLGPSSDPIGGLLTALGNRPPMLRHSAFGNQTIVLFPHQLRSGGRAAGEGEVDDLPLEQPGLIRAMTMSRGGRAQSALKTPGAAEHMGERPRGHDPGCKDRSAALASDA